MTLRAPSTSPACPFPPPWGFVWVGSVPTFVSSCQALRIFSGCLPLILSHAALKFLLLALVSA